MAYNKTNWVNDSFPAINAQNLNKIEQGIADNDAKLAGLLDPRGFIKDDYITENGDGTIDIELGNFVTSAVLTSDGGGLYFSIPVNRIFPKSTVVTRARGNISARASNSEGTGVYIMKSTSSGSSPAPFDTANSIWADFYDGANTHRTPSTHPTLTMKGCGECLFDFASRTANYITGSATITSRTNNNAVVVYVTQCVITLQIPT